jgi:hypothetical protein
MTRVIVAPMAPGADAQVRFTCLHCGWHIMVHSPNEAAGHLRPDHCCTNQVRFEKRQVVEQGDQAKGAVFGFTGWKTPDGGSSEVM